MVKISELLIQALEESKFGPELKKQKCPANKSCKHPETCSQDKKRYTAFCPYRQDAV